MDGKKPYKNSGQFYRDFYIYQGVPQNCSHFVYANLSASYEAGIKVLYVLKSIKTHQDPSEDQLNSPPFSREDLAPTNTLLNVSRAMPGQCTDMQDKTVLSTGKY